MLTGTLGWAIAVIFISAIWITVLIRRGPSEALAAAVVLSFACPVWLKVTVAELPFSVQTTIAIIALIGYSVHPQGKILTPLTMLDVCIGLMCIVHVLSDSMADGFSVDLPLRAYGEWVLPFVAGRFAIRDRTSVDSVAKWIPPVLLLLSVCACIEAVTRVNPLEIVFGERPLEGFPRTASRLGFKRAYGTALHPIFFGMLMFVLLPWLTVFLSRVHTTRTRSVVITALVATALGITATVSRIPWLAMLAASGVLLAIWYRGLRWPAAAVVAAVIGCVVAFPNQTADALSRWTGGGDRKSLVEIDGKAEEYTSSRNRLLIFPAYGDALKHARVTGYGTKLTTGFPPRIPYLQSERHSAERLKNVDNAYVLMALRFGWLGVTALTVLLATAVGTAFNLYRVRPDQNILAALSALLLVLMPALLMTWMSSDFGFAVLWTLGIVAGLSSSHLQALIDRRSRA